MTKGGVSLADKLELIATQAVPYNENLYILIDFLNRTLKHKNLIFGVSQRDGEMVVSIYET
ncbi:MAG: YpmA family protein [Firmicutes bacterium]|nr:YpmA family protein [Bacillota bacterium]